MLIYNVCIMMAPTTGFRDMYGKSGYSIYGPVLQLPLGGGVAKQVD